MKKLLLVLSLPVLSAGLAMSIGNMHPVFAEDDNSEPEVSEVIESSEPIESEEEEEEVTEEELIDKFKAWAGQYVNGAMIANIVTWFCTSGVMGALVFVYNKYRKYKAMSLEDVAKLTKAQIENTVKECFDKLSVEQIDKIKNGLGEVEQAQETIMKVMVLMQDTSRKGKVALLDFLGSKTKSEEVKVMAEDLKGDLDTEIAKEEKVKDAVKEEYEKVF